MITLHGTASTLVLSGEVDLADRPMLQSRLDELANAPVLVVDLCAVTYLDSTLIAALVHAWHQRRATPGSMRIIPPASASVCKILRLAGVDHILPFVYS